jgi:excisionase family DNA binding protein
MYLNDQTKSGKVGCMGEGELLTEAQVARLLTVSLSTMKRLRRAGDGPPFVRISKRGIRYRRADVDAWLSRRSEG